MERFLKGIIVGIGGVAPGLSGSVLLIIFGLYRKTLEALGSLLKDLRNNLRFLAPLVAGMFAGVLLFSRVIDFCLASYEMPTRFCLKNTGPGLLHLTPMAVNNSNGDVSSSSTAEPTISTLRLIIAQPKRSSGVARILISLVFPNTSMDGCGGI